MLFLLNDVVFDVSLTQDLPREDLHLFERLNLEALISLACDLYAETPDLESQYPVRAQRLAYLISQVGEGINAAQFYAPKEGCNPLLVEPRFCVLPLALLQELRDRRSAHRHEVDSLSLAEQMVWSQRAA